MLNSYNKNFEPMNFNEKIQFDLDKPCIFVVYPPGASGDFLASIINSHYIHTGADYFGIDELGQVIFRPSDYKITNHYPTNLLFSKQWVYDIRDSLAERNKSYSNLNQFIFSNHLYTNKNIEKIFRALPYAKIIKIYPENICEQRLIQYQTQFKNFKQEIDIEFPKFISKNKKYQNNSKILHIPYGSFFQEREFEKTYSSIVEFLQLNGKLINFEFNEYYKGKQSLTFQDKLQEYLDYKNRFIIK